jgi:hypothetical protein
MSSIHRKRRARPLLGVMIRDHSDCVGPAPDRLEAHRQHQWCYDQLPDFVREWIRDNPEYIDARLVHAAWHGVCHRVRDPGKQEKEMRKILDQATAEAAGLHDEEMQKAYAELSGGNGSRPEE